MRYRADLPEPIPASADDTMVFGTAIYSLLLGLGLAVAGWRVRKYWLAAIGAILTVSSASYLLARFLGML